MRSQVKEDLRLPQYWGLCGLKGCWNREPGMFLQKLMLIILSIDLGDCLLKIEKLKPVTY